jgi:hypothetical protein
MGARSVRRPVVALVAVVVATCGRRARAQEPTSTSHREIVVRPSTCGDLPVGAGAWVDLLRVELAADHVEVRAVGGDSPPPGAPQVAIEPSACAGSPTNATLTYSAGELRRSRTVSLVDIEPVARPRVLAMAMAELVRSGMVAAAASPSVGRAELDVHVQLVAPPPPRIDTRDAAPSLGWFGAAETRAFVQAAGGVFGARAGAHVPLGSWIEWVADAGVLFGSAHDALGDIDGTVATAGTALLGVGGTSGLLLGVGPRAEAGLGWFRGHATVRGATSSSATAPLALIALSAEASFRVSPPLWGWLGLDVGTSLYGFNGLADNRQVSDFSGPMVSVRIGVLWTR